MGSKVLFDRTERMFREDDGQMMDKYFSYWAVLIAWFFLFYRLSSRVEEVH